MKDVGSIKPKPLIGEILPGFTFLSLVLYCYFTAHPCQFDWIISKGGAITIAASGLVLVVSWIIGDFFDAFREILEDQVLDRLQRLYWDFFFEADREKADQVEDYYYSYYELNINFAVAIFWFLLSEFLFYLFGSTFIKLFPWYVNLIILPLVTVIFAWDAMILRGEIKKNLDKVKPKTK